MSETPDNGIRSEKSKYSVSETLDRLEAVVKAKGMIIFARIDQTAMAETVGLELRPTQLLLFGSPKAGTPLMVKHPTIAIDFPMKGLAWQDDDGQVWLTFNCPDWLRARHGITEPVFPALPHVFHHALE